MFNIEMSVTLLLNLFYIMHTGVKGPGCCRMKVALWGCGHIRLFYIALKAEEIVAAQFQDPRRADNMLPEWNMH